MILPLLLLQHECRYSGSICTAAASHIRSYAEGWLADLLEETSTNPVARPVTRTAHIS